MTEIQTRQQAREAADVHQAGSWYIAALDDPRIAVQHKLSEAHAREKLADRWEEYTAEVDDGGDIRLGTSSSEDERQIGELVTRYDDEFFR